MKGVIQRVFEDRRKRNGEVLEDGMMLGIHAADFLHGAARLDNNDEWIKTKKKVVQKGK